MAYRISELIRLDATSQTAKAKEKARQEASRVILEAWKYRQSWPRSTKQLTVDGFRKAIEAYTFTYGRHNETNPLFTLLFGLNQNAAETHKLLIDIWVMLVKPDEVRKTLEERREFLSKAEITESELVLKLYDRIVQREQSAFSLGPKLIGLDANSLIELLVEEVRGHQEERTKLVESFISAWKSMETGSDVDDVDD